MKTLILSLSLITIVLLLGCGNQPKSQEALNAELWEAVKIADVARVESLLESGADPNVTGQSENMVVTHSLDQVNSFSRQQHRNLVIA